MANIRVLQKQVPMGSQAGQKEKFTFFYASRSIFSQFYPSEFVAVPLYGGNQTPIKFVHCEQWMMYNKAMLFGDLSAAQQILGFYGPRKCKAIGRKVKNFDERIWKEHNQAIVYHGNKHKFTQNADLFEDLKATVGTTLVEASPRDCVYGIGLDAKNKKALDRSTWRGQNLLGEILTRLRNDIC